MKEVYNILLKKYGLQGWWPLHGKHSGNAPKNNDEQFEISLGAILTQNTNWNNVEKALKNLRPIKINRLDKIEEQKLAQLIKPSGYYNQKAKKIKLFIKFLKEKKEINRENLLGIWGLGPETVDSILLYAYNKPYFVIDAYTKRIFSRLGYEFRTYDEWQQFFHENVNKKIYKEYHALLVEHAKKFCKTKPKCKECSLKELCKFKS